MKFRAKDALGIFLNALFILFLAAMLSRYGDMRLWFWFGMDLAAFIGCMELAAT
jgi:hypothetical protein